MRLTASSRRRQEPRARAARRRRTERGSHGLHAARIHPDDRRKLRAAARGRSACGRRPHKIHAIRRFGSGRARRSSTTRGAGPRAMRFTSHGWPLDHGARLRATCARTEHAPAGASRHHDSATTPWEIRNSSGTIAMRRSGPRASRRDAHVAVRRARSIARVDYAYAGGTDIQVDPFAFERANGRSPVPASVTPQSSRLADIRLRLARKPDQHRGRREPVLRSIARCDHTRLARRRAESDSQRGAEPLRDARRRGESHRCRGEAAGAVLRTRRIHSAFSLRLGRSRTACARTPMGLHLHR